MVNGVGWLTAIIVGGLAGWLAEKVMHSNLGLVATILLGIVGAVVLNLVLSLVAPTLIGYGWVAFLVTGFVGACLLIALARMVRRA